MSEGFQLFEALPAHIEDALRASIRRFGVLVPITVDQNGLMLDGHHRRRIADELGVPYDRLVRVCESDEERREIARTLNADRRQLTEEQRRAVAVELRQEGHSYRAIAGALGVSKDTVQRDVEREAIVSPETIAQPERVIRQGGGSYPARRPQVIARDDREQERAQVALTSLAESNVEMEPSTLGVKEATRAAARQRTPDPVAEPVAPPDGQFSAIVIDPPWPMQKIERDERPNQGVALDYPTMSVRCLRPSEMDAIEDRVLGPVPCFMGAIDDPDIEPCQSIECVVGRVLGQSAVDDCHIYLWVSHKYLPAGLELLTSWGFNYQCVMTWRKNVGITPYSWMYDTEHVLFGRRGNLPLNRLGMRLSFEAPVQGHSVKPDVFYERVTEASPGPRLEMFARTNRDGFTAWGNEVPADGLPA